MNELPTELFSIEHENEVMVVYKTTYTDGNLAFILETEGCQPYAKISVNLPEVADQLEDGEFFVPVYKLDESLRNKLLDTGHFTQTNRKVQHGFTESVVWRCELPV